MLDEYLLVRDRVHRPGPRAPAAPTSDAWSRYDAGKCTQARLDVTAADARGAGAFSTLLLVGSMLVIAAFIVGRKATRAAESEPLLATTA